MGAPVPFEVVPVGDPALPRQDRAATLAFQNRVGALQNRLIASRRLLDQALEDVRAIAELAGDGRKLGLDALAEARALEQRLLDAQETVAGDPLPDRHGHVGSPSILDRAQSALFGTLRQTYGPTRTHRDQLALAESEFATLEPDLRTLLDVDVPALKARADAAGAPWTSGRRIP